MQRVAHHAVCKLYEHRVSADGQLFAMIMELMEMGTLADRIKSQDDGRLREFETIQMAFDVLAALAHMHDMGVIHRDGTLTWGLFCLTYEKTRHVERSEACEHCADRSGRPLDLQAHRLLHLGG